MGEAADDGTGWAATRAWAGEHLAAGERIERVELLRGGWSARMRRLDITGPQGGRSLVLRSFVKPFYVRHAPGLLTREADVLRLLGGTGIPVARCVAVDPRGEHCDHPSLLMSLLPGEVRVDDAGAAERGGLLAAQLAAVHRVEVDDRTRPRDYEAWTGPDRVRVPAATARPLLWRRAVDVIRREPPAYVPRFLHRDFHPGNVLFLGEGARLRIGGVVDWVETSWGPADLDVAHCSTALALLHGPSVGMGFAGQYAAAGGRPLASGADHLYWRLLDALAHAPDAEKVAVPWRELGRADLTPGVLMERLEKYVECLLEQFDR
ncbi:phosphotransferase family protein [Streptomyces sp. NBC_00893]|uniref:phosphotransferase family protein n=1 Tax=Streptomyces sp. NBC_00893 TaxID=2975862 RepID=UPI002256BA91|nr:phosphotransferase [Streptomyces sp. NBC_00893]MCX4847298.1 phosphotransferase [Streptomyces sp. NBC_00893]